MNDSIFSLIQREEQRQIETLQMIPSENIASEAVMNAVGSVLMNKYSEGQVGKRYYQGNENVDEIERLCKERALQAFGLESKDWGVNVQSLSGSPANLAVYNALLEPQDTIMSMDLTHGGHLSHGWMSQDKKISIVSKIYQICFYGVEKETQVFNYDNIALKAQKNKPKLIVAGGTAYPREIDHERIAQIAQSVGAYYLADVAHEAGLIAGGANKSPFAFADIVTMTTHKTLRGPRGALIFARNDLMSAIDFSVFPGIQGGPHNHTIAGIAVALQEAISPQFGDYVHQVVQNAQKLAQIFMDSSLKVVSQGTDKHLILLDLRSINHSGWIGAWALEGAGIIANRNTVPFETASPFYPSGLRLGTPAITTRGMGLSEMEQIGVWITEILKYSQKWTLPENPDQRRNFTQNFAETVKNDPVLTKYREEIKNFSRQYPLHKSA